VDSEPDIGKLGRYDIVRILGRGAMGVVYEGRDPNLDRRVAIKTIRIHNLSHDAAVEYHARFRTEARSAARLSHPNIVNVFDSGQDQTTSYLVMEFIQGEDLKHHLDGGARFSVHASLTLVHDLLMALEHAHRQNVVHRDVKPANMLIEPSGRVKLTDFGVARIQDTDETHLTQVGAVVGTPKYMSPEQAKGERGDSRSDVFSASVVLYELLTGKQPFAGGGQFVVIHQIVNLQPPAPSALNPSLPAALDEVLARAMAKNPDERYATAREFALALRSLMQQMLAAPGSLPPDRPLDNSNTEFFAPKAEVVLASTISHEDEIASWEKVQNSGNAQDLQDHLHRFPASIHTRKAQLRLPVPSHAAAKGDEMGSRWSKRVPLYVAFACVAGGLGIVLLVSSRFHKTAEPVHSVVAGATVVGQPASSPTPSAATVSTPASTAAIAMALTAASVPSQASGNLAMQAASRPRSLPSESRPASALKNEPPEAAPAAPVAKAPSPTARVKKQSALEQYHLGQAYFEGKGVAQDVAMALRLYRLAAEQGLPQAQTELGRAYAKGEGVQKDAGEAYRWYHLAADQGYPPAQAYMARANFRGLGVKKDDAQAARWARMAAEKGDAYSQFLFGLMLQKGQGIAKDDAQAMHWIRLSSDQGNASGQSYLGYMTFHGYGTAPNVQEALRLYRLSVEQSNSEGQNNLGWMYANGFGVPKNDVEAVRLYRLSANQGNPLGLLNLAHMLHNGRGVMRDEEQALKLYRLSAAQGNEKAAEMLRKLAPAVQ